MTSGRPLVSSVAAGWTLALLFLANVLNVGDRMLLGVVTEPVRHDLVLSDTQMALANGLLFVLFNLIAGLFIARLVDRGNRVRNASDLTILQICRDKRCQAPCGSNL